MKFITKKNMLYIKQKKLPINCNVKRNDSLFQFIQNHSDAKLGTE